MLPAPNLDDRTFQDLVDEAKRLVQHRCPEWTDHNVSDPGVTLIEAFAQMVDQLIYRLNRVPDLNYVKFLELIGVELRPPAAARGRVTFWLSAPQPQPVLVRAETQVATPAHRHPRPGRLLDPARPEHRARARSPGPAPRWSVPSPVDLTAALPGEQGFAASRPHPTPGDALLIGLSNAVPSCAVTLRMDCTVAGVGVDPRRPPRVWEAWTGTGWIACEVDHDDTGGLNKDGDVVLHVPDDHQASIIARRAGRLAALPAGRGPARPADLHRAPAGRTRSPRSPSAARRRWCTPRCMHRESLGRSDGTPGQRFPLQRRPGAGLDRAPARCRCATPGGRAGVDRGAALRRVRPGRPALPRRPRRRRGAVRAGGAAGRRRAAPLRRGAAARRDAAC